MAALPSVLGTDDLPLAELGAARLDGELVPLARGFVPVDLVEDAENRVRASALGLPPAWIAELGTAAWIWGARETAPDPGRFCVPPSGRGANPREGVILREIRIDPSGWVDLSGARATTPVRTLEALLRGVDFDPEAARSVARLIRIAGSAFVPEVTAERLARLPYGRRASRRMAEILGTAARAGF